MWPGRAIAEFDAEPVPLTNRFAGRNPLAEHIGQELVIQRSAGTDANAGVVPRGTCNHGMCALGTHHARVACADEVCDTIEQPVGTLAPRFGIDQAARPLQVQGSGPVRREGGSPERRCIEPSSGIVAAVSVHRQRRSHVDHGREFCRRHVRTVVRRRAR